MKTIEEKAKAYDEAKARMSAAYNSNRCTIGFMNEIFPELAESEDERTWIINYLNNRKLNSSIMAEKENLKKAIAWLEKQGEKKTAESTDLRTWKYIVDAVLTERNGIGQYINSPWTEYMAKKLQERFGSIEQKPVEDVNDKEKEL